MFIEYDLQRASENIKKISQQISAERSKITEGCRSKNLKVVQQCNTKISTLLGSREKELDQVKKSLESNQNRITRGSYNTGLSLIMTLQMQLTTFWMQHNLTAQLIETME